MAFGLRYYNEFTSRHYKRLIRVEILERDYVGASKQIKMGASLQLSDSGDGREVPIKKLTASLRLVSESNFQFEHLFTADDRKYQVKIQRNGQTRFVGFLESDSYSEPYYSWKNYTVNLTARDNLGRLEDIPYLDINGDRVIGLESASDILDRAILNTGYFLLKSNKIGIKSSDMGAGSVLSQTYINNDAFWDFEENEPLSCLDVITNIISGFGSQLRQINNTWQIVDQAKFYEQTTIQGNSASFPSYLASKLNFPLITKAFKWINRDAEMTVLPAWKEFSLKQDTNVPDSFFSSFPYSASNYINQDPGFIRWDLVGWDMNGYKAQWDPSSSYFYFYPVNNDANWHIESSEPVTQTLDVIKVSLGYYNASVFFYGQPITHSPQIDILLSDGIQQKILDPISGWVDDVGQTRLLEFTNISLSGISSPTNVDVLIVDIPFDGELKIRIWSKVAAPWGLRYVNYSFRADNLIKEETAAINDDNNLKPSDFNLNIGQVPISENSNVTYLGGLFTSAGVAQVDWKREGDTTAENLLKKVAIGYDLQNKQPSRQVNGTVIWDYDLWTNIDDQNKRLMINSADWDLNTDEMSAEWVQVFEYKNTKGDFNNDFNDDFENQVVNDYDTNTTFTLTQKTE